MGYVPNRSKSCLSKMTWQIEKAIYPLHVLFKKREAVSPSGFTRRYGNSIRSRIGQVRRDGLDGCVYS